MRVQYHELSATLYYPHVISFQIYSKDDPSGIFRMRRAGYMAHKGQEEVVWVHESGAFVLSFDFDVEALGDIRGNER